MALERETPSVLRRVFPASVSPTFSRHRADALALAAFFAGVAIVMTVRATNTDWLAEYDILTFFLPWYGMLGERLRAFDIPGWTPLFASGSPLAGDPSAGWMYLPVMLTFPFLGVIAAFIWMVVLQLVIGGLATYAFARRLGLGALAALTSTTAFAFGPFFFAQVSYGTVAGQASTWIPVALLGAECSLRTPRWLSRAAWWSLADLAVSQIAVSWPGQGLMNALLIIGGWVGYRAVLSPPAPRPPGIRLRDALVTGSAVLALGLLLGAAGILPRLAVSAASNIPNGDYTNAPGGNYLAQPHSLVSLLRDTLKDDVHFRPTGLSGAVVILGLLAVLLARRRFGVPFFATVLVVAGILSTGETPLHRLFDLIPQFEVIHQHAPRRILWVCPIAPAMLAGAAVEALPRWRDRRGALPLLLLPLGIVITVAVMLDRDRYWVGWWTLVPAAVVTALEVVVVRPPRRRAPVARLAIVGMILLVFITPAGRDAAGIVLGNKVREEDSRVACPAPAPLATALARTDPGGAGAFLQRRQAEEGPFRFVGYAGRDPATDDPSYSTRRCEPEVLAVLVNGRGARLGLEQIQGYNPQHLLAYVEFVAAMNGGPQDYHWVDPYPRALLGSPLLDLLNVRYIVVSTTDPRDAELVSALALHYPEVFSNGHVVVYENPGALPRAWIVHDVRQDDGTALAQLADGRMDGRQVAFVDGPLPEVAPPGAMAGQVGAPVDERVTVTTDGGDALTAEVRAMAPGLVVFSEAYADGWRAEVDGQPVEILRTDHALRGVPVSAGAHPIVLRYEPASLRIGLWVSGLTGAATLAVAGAAIFRAIRERGAARLIARGPAPGGGPDRSRRARTDPR
jgi:hypothetical protein